MTACVWHYSCVRVTWLIHLFDMTHLNMWHDAFKCFTGLTVYSNSCIRCAMTHSAVQHEWFEYVTWLICMCDMTYSIVRHDSFGVVSLWLCDVTQCVAVCCSVLQSVAVCCSVLQCVAVCCSVLQSVAVCCSVLQCVAVCCSVLQCVAECCSVLQCVLQSVAVCCIVLHLWRNSLFTAIPASGVTWFIHLFDMPHFNTWHDSIICVTWLIHVIGTTYLDVWLNSQFISISASGVPWLIRAFNKPHLNEAHLNVWHDSPTTFSYTNLSQFNMLI